MMPEELIKQLLDLKVLDLKAAKITAEVDENGKNTVALKGRGIEIISLSIVIIEAIMKDSNGALTVDEYCEMLKYTINEMSKPKE